MLNKFKNWFHKKLNGKRFVLNKLDIVFFLYEGVLFLHNRKGYYRILEEKGETNHHFITRLFRLYHPNPVKLPFSVSACANPRVISRSEWTDNKYEFWSKTKKN